jgi:hypothetical protein
MKNKRIINASLEGTDCKSVPVGGNGGFGKRGLTK